MATAFKLNGEPQNLNWYGELSSRLREAADTRSAGAVTPYFGKWLKEVDNEYRWDYRHFRRMQETLDQVTAGLKHFVYFQVAIRHGKTEHNTVRYGAYRLVRNPRTRLIVASYNQDKALDYSRKIRKWMDRLGVPISRKVDGASHWETLAGGEVRAFGRGSGVAGNNADLILIDDPLGSRSEAESKAIRGEAWDWITNDILARRESHTAALMTMSRWHTDDPAGRLLARMADLWELVDLPGRAEPCLREDCPQSGTEHSHDILDRKPGELLWPEIRDETWHTTARRTMGEYGYASLIQGRPRPREGGFFKYEWWGSLPEVPKTGLMVRYWDVAGTKKDNSQKNDENHDPDYTAGVLACRMEDQRTAICDVVRGQWSTAQRDAMIYETAKADVAKYGGRIVYWFETQAGIGGKEATMMLLRWCQTLGLPAYSEPAVVAKEIRAQPLASAAETGNVLLVDGGEAAKYDPRLKPEWVEPFKEELAECWGGVHDDQADGASGAFNKLNGSEGLVARQFKHRI